MKGTRLSEVRQIRIDAEVVSATLEALQSYGADGLEGLVLWLGEIDGDCARISRALIPEQKAISSESGVGYFIDGTTLFRLNRALSDTGLRLIAQVHSHPTEAYHSETDDRYAIVTAEGGFSFVVPNFGRAPLDPSFWAVYRLNSGEWRPLDRKAAASLISLEA